MAKKASKKVKRIVPQANIIRGNAPSANAVPSSAIGSAISAGGPFDSTINSAAGSMPSVDPALQKQFMDSIGKLGSQPVGSSGSPATPVAVPVAQPVAAPVKAKAQVKKKKKPNMQEMVDAIEAGQGDQYIKKATVKKKG